MLEGKELILATREYANENKSLSWFYTISTLILMIVSILATAIIELWYVKLILSIISGLLMVRMFIIYHDYEHKAILVKSKAASWLMKAYGIWILVPQSIWKRSHDYHHAHNSKLFSASIGSYPIMTKEKFMNASKSERFGYLAIRHPITIFFAYITTFMYGMCILSLTSSPKRHYDSLIALLIHASIAISFYIIGGWSMILFVQTIPFFVASLMGSYLFYAQHNFPGVEFKKNIEWSYEHAALESSSFMPMNPIMQWFTANIGFHHIHHMNAKIPFYRLPEVMKKMPELQKVKVTTLNPIDIIRCLRLKVWDPDQKKMIGLREVRGL